MKLYNSDLFSIDIGRCEDCRCCNDCGDCIEYDMMGNFCNGQNLHYDPWEDKSDLYGLANYKEDKVADEIDMIWDELDCLNDICEELSDNIKELSEKLNEMSAN